MKKKQEFIFLYLLASTEFLGYVNLDKILFINEYALGFAVFDCVAIISLVWSLSRYKLDAGQYLVIVALSAFFVYGIIVPWYCYGQGLLNGVIAGKHMMSMAFFAYVMISMDKVDVGKVISFLAYLGLYLSFVVVFGEFSGLVPPEYLEVKKGVGEYVRVSYPTYILIAILLLSVELWKIKGYNNKLIVLLLLFVALFFSDYKSLFFGGLLLYVLVILNKINYKWLGTGEINYWSDKVNKILVILMAFLVILSAGYIAYDANMYGLKDWLDYELYSSLSSRGVYNYGRWEAISDKKFVGYGYLYKENPLTYKYLNTELSGYTETLSFIDSGYVDVFIKYGQYIGLIYLLFWVVVFYKAKLACRNEIVSNGVFLLVFVMLIINYSWAVFTYRPGIIMLSIIMVFLKAKY